MSERFAAALADREAEAAREFRNDSEKPIVATLLRDIKHLTLQPAVSGASDGIEQGWSLKFDREA
ncbi:hypothetical protein HFO33_34245 [Rhizobium leguminosarum]|uniref:hypothetical protein n=1 Tax=Rhizobium leguminosarum TaxID=384 RepID=UPI001C961EF9|nr:hypothetical protein [Rhizobium leguminosarum]MBY5667387.1 hypothetical protein [Rhizobium leguminosarum]MBY5710107.1 hypothetical protein [Rhizobium leguminosarum]MBY5721559.1 hypothetical protein [Rhizobium leguminosarum]